LNHDFDSHSPDATKADLLASRLFFTLTFVFIVFVAIASLTPGQSSIPSLQKWKVVWLNLFTSPGKVFSYHNLRDIATNVLLYLPLGLFLSLAVSWRRPRFFTFWLAAGTVISFSLEMIQVNIGRHSDPVDVMTNTTGFVLGFWMVVVAIKSFGLRPSAFLGIGPAETLDQQTQSITALRFLYICAYFVVALVPFDISVKASQVYAQLTDKYTGTQRIVLDPFYHFRHWQTGGGLRLLLELLGLVPMAVLTTLLGSLKRRPSIFAAISACLILAGLSEAAQLFIMSRTSDMVMLPLAVIAGILGWRISLIWINMTTAPAGDSANNRADRINLSLLALGAWTLIVCLLAWAPYNFEIFLKEILDKIRNDSNLIPFKLHFDSPGIGSALDMVKEAGIFIPMGLLLTLYLSLRFGALNRTGLMIITAVGCVIIGTGVELSQAACVGRYIDVTDILLAGAGGLAGSALFRLFSRERPV
jgi:glycopeptide antibiotics resistance protein